MQLVDSHCHLDRLDLEPFDHDIAQAVAATRAAGVAHMLCVGINLSAWPAMMDLVRLFDDVSASVGVHPNEVDEPSPTVERLVEAAAEERVVAIGETGLDYFRSQGDLAWQRERFRVHIRAALACRLPLIVHTREAMEDTLRILDEEGAGAVGGVMHCFTGNADEARRALDLGFHISFSGIVTFGSADDIRGAARMTPDDRILIETDAPYLAPAPHRGKSNRPAWVRLVAERVAAERGVEPEVLARQTGGNFARLFGVAIDSADN